MSQRVLFVKTFKCEILLQEMSRIMRKPKFCICENKDADQLRGYREADQRLCFRYIDSTIPLLSKSEISILQPSSVAVQPGLCRTRSHTRTLVFSQRGSNHKLISNMAQCTMIHNSIIAHTETLYLMLCNERSL